MVTVSQPGEENPPHVLVIVQNLPVPFDRRVWLECQALRDDGFHVSVICPRGDADVPHEVLEGVEIHRYRPYPPTQAKVGFVLEYLYSFARTAWLLARVLRPHRIDVIQTCNPPDIFWPLLLLVRAMGGRVVFDQHDLCPELYESRFPDGPQLPARVLRLLERCTYAAADHVVATNESYRDTALRRGGKRTDEVTVVRTGPDPDRLKRRAPEPSLRRGRTHLVCYLGVMGPQDGVDVVVRAADIIVHRLGRRDVSFTLLGTGDCFADLVELRDSLALGDVVEFTGRASDELVFRVLSTADVGLSPDPRNPLNDVSTMNKTMEYMAFELPVVAFDLRETRVSAQESAVYVGDDEVESYANAIVDLLDDEARRREMGTAARRRVEDVLAWSHQRPAYVGVYRRLTGRAGAEPAAVGGR